MAFLFSTFKKSIFLSYPKPHLARQEVFIVNLCEYLDSRGFAPRTLGVSDYDMSAPLSAIRRLMRESNGLLTVAFRRSFVPEAIVNHGSTVADRPSRTIRDYWDTSIWSHVEPAMAFQMGLPILILRESGVIANGMLEAGVVGTYMPEFDLDSPPEEYFSSLEWQHLIQKWEMQVNLVVERKGQPPQLY